MTDMGYELMSALVSAGSYFVGKFFKRNSERIYEMNDFGYRFREIYGYQPNRYMSDNEIKNHVLANTSGVENSY